MEHMKRFTTEPMREILLWLRDQFEEAGAGTIVAFEVLDPDLGGSRYAGERVEADGECFVYRGYKAWSDLAELLFCKMLTPRIASAHSVVLRFEKLDIHDSFHTPPASEKEEKYGVASRFFSINKNEEPAFLAAYLKALESVKVEKRTRILNLGINTGDEFALIKEMLTPEQFGAIEFVGIDHSPSAIAHARKRFADDENVSFHVHDINTIGELGLGRFDLIVTIGTLQSPGIDFKPFFMTLVQTYLEKGGAMILGFPNCRWMGGEMIYGAKAPNYAYSELSLLYKDAHYCKKYLQQKKFRVTLTGKEYLFLTATAIGIRQES